MRAEATKQRDVKVHERQQEPRLFALSCGPSLPQCGDGTMHEAAELDEWVPQCARIEDEQRELKQRGTSVDFLELNECRWPLFEGHEPFYEELYCGARSIPGSPYCVAHEGQAFTR
jgi:hypothetical protein